MSMSSTLRAVSIAMVCTAGLAGLSPVQAQSRFHASGVSGAQGTAVRGGYTTSSNGNVVHQGGTAVSGANGGSFVGRNSYTKNADGSAQSSHSYSGTTASGGTVNGSGAYSRSSSGAVTGSSQSSGSSAKGSYNTSTDTANGVTQHDTSVTNAAGDNYNGQTTYTKGEGVTHSGSCTNASGAAIACGQ